MLEFVDSDLYFVLDKFFLLNPLLQVGSGSWSVEKSTGSGSGGAKINGHAQYHRDIHNTDKVPDEAKAFVEEEGGLVGDLRLKHNLVRILHYHRLHMFISSSFLYFPHFFCPVLDDSHTILF